MDRRFVQYYERELRYIRELAAEFGRAFPKVAGRLGITDNACDDPHVERLMQGHAFVGAGVHQRLDAEFSSLPQTLLEHVAPGTLGPTPSMTIVQFQPDVKQGSLNRGYEIARGSALRAKDKSGSRVCEFRTAHPVRLWPIAIESVHYTSVLRDFADLRIPTREPVQALLKLRLRTEAGRSFASLGLSELPLYLHGGDEVSGRLFEALVANVSTLVVRYTAGGRPQAMRSSAIGPVRPLAFDDEHALLPVGPSLLRGYRMLREYFALPSRFHFVELCGLGEAAARCDSDTLELVVALRKYDPSLEGEIPTERVKLFATPAINLFPRTCDALQLTPGEGRVLIVPEHARPLDFEVCSVERVTAAVAGSVHERELTPWHIAQGGHEQAPLPRYAIERATRTCSYEEQQLGLRSAQYPGDDVFIRLLYPGAANDGRRLGALRLQVHALCTNRDLPMQLALGQASTDFTTPSGAPLRAVRCVAGPTAPRSSQLQGAAAWEMIAHWSQTSLALRDAQTGGEALRELLRLFCQGGDAQLQREVDGVRSVAAGTVIRPLPIAGPRQFARGLEIKLTCEEQAFGAHRAFTLAAVLSQFFARHASEHSFAETVLQTPERGEVHRWPPVAGLRHAL